MKRFILSLIIILLFSLGVSGQYYQCEVSSKNIPECAKNGVTHYCQIYDHEYEPSLGTPEYCYTKCTARAGLSKECVGLVKVGPSINPEAHESLSKKWGSKLKDIFTKAVEYDESSNGDDTTDRNNGNNPNKDADSQSDSCEKDQYWDGSKCEYRCEFDETWDGEVCINENDLYGVNNMQPGQFKVKDKIGILKYDTGAIQYTVDGIHYYESPEEAKHPGAWSRTKRGVGWLKDTFFGGKSNKADKNLAESIADQYIEDAESSKALKASGGSFVTGQTAGLIIGPTAMGATFAGSPVVLLAGRITTTKFRSDVNTYIQDRLIMSKSNVVDDLVYSESTRELFKSEQEMVATFENAYRRFCVAKMLKDETCPN